MMALPLAIEAPAPALPAAGDLEASAHHSRAEHGCFGRKLPSSRTCRGICY
jgi:hypothetical protein